MAEETKAQCGHYEDDVREQLAAKFSQCLALEKLYNAEIKLREQHVQHEGEEKENERGPLNSIENKATLISPQSDNMRSLSEEEVQKVLLTYPSMSGKQLRKALTDIGLSTHGNKKTLRKRVQLEYGRRYANMPKRVKAGLANKTLKFLDYLIVIDFECTCVEILYDYPHEIIEFPAVIVDVKELKITKEFRSFVKPTVNPILDPFCIKLTHITQEQVDSAPPFDAVLKQFFEWMQKNGLFEPNVRFAFVTDGPHDIWKFLQFQCEILCNIKMPHIFRPYINMKKFFETKFEAIQKGQGKSSLDIMLEYFDLGFEGSKHSGIDDARNIARIVIQMMKTGVEFRVNERCASKKHRNERNENYQNPSRNKNQLSDMHIWRKKLRLTSVNVARKESEPGKLLPCSSCEDLDDINTLSTRQASLLVRQEMLKNRTKRLDEVAFDGANCDQSDLPPDPEEGYEQQIVDHETSVQASKNYVCQRVKTANDAGFQFSRNLKVLMPPKLFLNE